MGNPIEPTPLQKYWLGGCSVEHTVSPLDTLSMLRCSELVAVNSRSVMDVKLLLLLI